jgi:competence protein ComEA
MIGFTKQEKRFALFFLVSIIVGTGVKAYRQQHLSKPDSEWQEHYQAVLTDFRQKAHSDEDTITQQQASIQKATPRIQKSDLVESIDINHATLIQLQTLPKIGPVLAQRIIDFRDVNGPFKSIDEIKSVKGIGPKTFIVIKNHIKVE